jgi:hypothetical protein
MFRARTKRQNNKTRVRRVKTDLYIKSTETQEVIRVIN